ncbi:MAG: adenosylmethionine decarboxylase [Hyphomicrobiaceae bacterium]|jgi:S-adenosylmethionine decarboxylase|nr:adenosylmethionine decarboxylase [Hyphomicrobiaceae bacterium]
MAFNDTLFQLGMDLTRSSTAHEEDIVPAREAFGSKKDFFVERDGVRFAGSHLIVDLFGAKRLDDLKHVEATLKNCVDASGATLLNIHLHHMPNKGVTGVAVLAESHISIHSWPEAEYAALDIFMSGDADPYKCVEILRQAFSAGEVVLKVHKRGEDMPEHAWKAGGRKVTAPRATAVAAPRTKKAA